jgi:nucleoside 2-deoxyribosyltransferase
MSVKASECPVCGLANDGVEVSDYGERASLNCPRCGTFEITGTASSVIKSRRLSPLFSAWLRARSAAGERPVISSTSIDQIAASLPKYRVSEKQLLLLRGIEQQTSYPGKPALVVTQYDYPLAWAESEEEFRYLLQSLEDRKLIQRVGNPGPLRENFSYRFVVTPEGWEHLDERASDSVVSNQVFVAMSFSDPLKPAFSEGIAVGLRENGWDPFRIDSTPHADRIDTRIMSEIKRSRFMVADVTEQRPGVYFEAGYALGIGQKVIWSVREDEMDKVHFDTRQYNHIIWKQPADLAEKVRHFVRAIVGEGSSPHSR